MTYAIANHNNANLTRETTQWVSGDYTITKIASWAVDSGVHAVLGLSRYCDVYKTSTGDWCATFGEAVAVCQEAHPIDDSEIADELDRSDLLDTVICEELALNISQINCDGGDAPVYEIRRNDTRLSYIYEPVDGFYELPQLCFAYTTFHSLNAAAIALVEFLRPADVLLAEAAAHHTVASRQAYPDYI